MTHHKTNQDVKDKRGDIRRGRRLGCEDGATRDKGPGRESQQIEGTTNLDLPSSGEVVVALDQQKLAVTVEEAAHLLSLNRTKIYALCMRGELRSLKIGRSRRIPMAALQEYLGVSA